MIVWTKLFPQELSCEYAFHLATKIAVADHMDNQEDDAMYSNLPNKNTSPSRTRTRGAPDNSKYPKELSMTKVRLDLAYRIQQA